MSKMLKIKRNNARSEPNTTEFCEERVQPAFDTAGDAAAAANDTHNDPTSAASSRQVHVADVHAVHACGAGADADADRGAVADADSGAGVDADADRCAVADADGDAGGDADADGGASAGADADANADADSNTDANMVRKKSVQPAFAFPDVARNLHFADRPLPPLPSSVSTPLPFLGCIQGFDNSKLRITGPEKKPQLLPQPSKLHVSSEFFLELAKQQEKFEKNKKNRPLQAPPSIPKKPTTIRRKPTETTTTTTTTTATTATTTTTTATTTTTTASHDYDFPN